MRIGTGMERQKRTRIRMCMGRRGRVVGVRSKATELLSVDASWLMMR